MMDIEKLKKIISTYQKPVLFLGAGCTCSSNGPEGSDITKFLLQDHYKEKNWDKIKKLFEQDYECEAIFENVMTKLFITNKSRKVIMEKYYKDLKLSEGYKYLALLLKLGYFYPIVFTTNHEELIEKCLNEDIYCIDRKVKVISLVQKELDTNIDVEDNTIYVIHIHGKFSSFDDIYVTGKDTFALSEKCKEILTKLCTDQSLIIIGYGYQDVDIRNALQTMPSMSTGIYYVSYSNFNRKNHELVKMLQHHQSEENVIENCSFDDFFEKIGKEAFNALQRQAAKNDVEKLFDMLDKVRHFQKIRASQLEPMVEKVDELLTLYNLDELLALKEFIYYEHNKNGEVYRLQQGIKHLENAIQLHSSFTENDYICTICYCLSNEYLNLFLLGDNILVNKIEYLKESIQLSQDCIKKLQTRQTDLKLKFLLLIGEALKEQAMLNEDSSSQKENIDKARFALKQATDLVETQNQNYYLGIAYRHLAITYELESDISSDNKEREKYISEWKKFSTLANDYLKCIEENTVRGYAVMNLAASNIPLLQLHANMEYRKKLIDEGLEHIQCAIQLHNNMDEYRGLAWSNIHKCKLLRLKIEIFDHRTINVHTVISEMEDSANLAINNILKTDDSLGKGLAYQQLGIALYICTDFLDSESSVKLDSSIHILQKSVDILKNTGYFRGLTDSCIWLSKAMYKKWKKTEDVAYFVDAYNNMSLGFVSASQNLNLISKLEEAYEDLRKRSNAIIDLIG